MDLGLGPPLDLPALHCTSKFETCMDPDLDLGPDLDLTGPGPRSGPGPGLGPRSNPKPALVDLLP